MSAQEYYYALEVLDEGLLDLLMPEYFDYETKTEEEIAAEEERRAEAERAEKAEEEFGAGNIWIFWTEMDDDVCDECWSYHGDVFTSKEIAEKWPWAVKRRAMIEPNVHPNCRCRLETLVTIEVI